MHCERAALASIIACALQFLACSSEPEATSMFGATGTGSTSASMAGSSAVGAGSSSGGQASAGAGAGAGAGGAGAGAGAGGGPPAMACSSYVDESSWSLVVQISNQRQQAVHVGQKNADCETARPFEVRDGSRSLLPALEKCPSSCQQLMQAAPTTCPAACPAPSTITIQPGETVKLPWDGRFAIPQSLPAQCASAAAQGTTTCVQAAHIEAGVFTFSAHGGTTRTCSNGSTTCTCTPSSYGGCVTAGSVIGGTIITTEYLVNLEPGEVSPGGEPPYIGLVFRE